MWVLMLIPIGTLAFGWIVSRFSPAWQYRYFAPILGALLLLAAFGLARAKGVGLIALALVVIFWANPKSYTPQYKSDMRDVAGELGAAAASGRPRGRRPARAGPARLVLPPGRGCGSRTRPGRARTRSR